MSHDSKKVYAALTGERRTKKKKSRREARIRFRAMWDLNATKVALVSTELYQECVKVAHGVKGIPEVWRYQTGTDTIIEALRAIGVSADLSHSNTRNKVRWMLEAFRRVSAPPAPDLRKPMTATSLMLGYGYQHRPAKFKLPSGHQSVLLLDYQEIEKRLLSRSFDELSRFWGDRDPAEPKEIGGHRGFREDHVVSD